MLDFLIPNYYFHSIHDVDLTFYVENNIKGILFDIDNTLEPYATRTPSEKTMNLFRSLKEAGIKTAVISNNHEERVSAFCEPLSVPFSFDSAKPSKKKINMAIEALELKNEDVIIVGDQLFTDIWAGSNSKVRSIFVDKINNSEGFFIKLKRVLEYPIVSFIRKKGQGKIK